MSGHHNVKGGAIREKLDHPVIDADGHWLEFGPTMREDMLKFGGKKALEGFNFLQSYIERELTSSVAERRASGSAQQSFWLIPTKNTLDRATGVMPKLMYQRLDEFGFDFCAIYPTMGLGLFLIPDAEARQATCRAYNCIVSEYFGPYSDRLTPAAAIPMHTPEEAIAELEYAVHELGLKIVMMGSLIPRDIPNIVERYPDPDVRRFANIRDVLGIDSPYDYDPVWRKCMELGISPAFHTAGRSHGLRMSPSNLVFNHIGHFAAANEAVCKALYIGGVVRRFPDLNFGFLESGVGWVSQMYGDMIEHWEKRNIRGLEEVNPANIDRELFLRLAEQYGDPRIVKALENPDAYLDVVVNARSATATGQIANLDDFAAAGITKASDIRIPFEKNFYFGCEADDRMNSLAFKADLNAFEARFNIMLGSDIGHFDVPDMAAVLPEAYEAVEDGLMTADNFRDFMCTTPVKFWGKNNPDFFRGTVVEKQAAEILGGVGRRTSDV